MRKRKKKEEQFLHIPRAKGQKVSFADIEQFPEKLTELFGRNFVLEYLVEILPPES